MVEGKSSDGVCVTTSSVLFGLIGKLLWLFGGLLDLSAQDDVGLNGLSKIQVPDLDIRQKGRDYCIISLGGGAAVDGA